MATREEHARILRRYYSEPVVVALMRGYAASGLAGLQHAIPSHHPTFDTEAIILRRARRRLARLPKVERRLTEREEEALHTRFQYHINSTAERHANAAVWNRLLGRDAVYVCPSGRVYVERAWDKWVEAWTRRADAHSRVLIDSINGTPPVLRRMPARITTVLGPFSGCRPVEDIYIADNYLESLLYMTEGARGKRGLVDVVFASANGASLHRHTLHKMLLEKLGAVTVRGPGEVLQKLGVDLTTMSVADTEQTIEQLLGTNWIRANTQIALLADGSLPAVVQSRVAHNLGKTLHAEPGTYHSNRGVLVGSQDGDMGYTYGVEWEVDAVDDAAARENVMSRSLRGVGHLGERLLQGAAVELSPVSISIHQIKRVFAEASGATTYIHPEHDSSLSSGYGYEWVTAYRPYESHLRIIDKAVTLHQTTPWLDTVEGADNGGIHIHVGRERGDGSTIGNVQLMALSNFISDIRHDEFVRHMTGRYVAHSRWVKRPDEATRGGILTHQFLDHVWHELKHHYYAVNTRPDTVEFRIFASGGIEAVRDALGMIDSLMHFTDFLVATVPVEDAVVPRVADYLEWMANQDGRWPTVQAKLHAWRRKMDYDMAAAEAAVAQAESTDPHLGVEARQPMDALLAALYPVVSGDFISEDVRRELVRNVVNDAWST